MTTRPRTVWTQSGINSFLIIGLALLTTGSASSNALKEKNQACLRAILREAPTALEALAVMFTDPCLLDDGTIQGRVRAILAATEHPSVPGLQTGIYIGMTGFRQELQDPWPTSTDQAGHFLTAVRLATDTKFLSSPVYPILLGEWGDDEVALRLVIGHEKEPDPPDADKLKPDLKTFIAVTRSIRAQYHSVTQADLANFRVGQWQAIQVGSGSGNSVADLQLSYLGWQFGRWIAEGHFQSKNEIAQWIRDELGKH